jgi:large subunit ribosomal protein L24
MKIRNGDTVEVISGKSQGQRGKVLKISTKHGVVIVEGVNKAKKHIRKSQKFPQSTIMSIERPIAVSKVMLVCPITDKPTRIGKVKEEDGWKRFSKKAKAVIK